MTSPVARPPNLRMTAKNFILDTNVLLHDPRAIFGFGDNTVCIPIVVIEEIDTFKKDVTELGRNAREVTRQIDAMRRTGSLTEGVALPGGGKLRVVLTQRDLPRGHSITHQADNRIIATALFIKETEPDRPAIFVTLDTNLRIRANALGLHAEDFEPEAITLDELYPGVTAIDMPPGSVSALYEAGWLPLPEPSGQQKFYENEYVMVADGHGTALGRIALAAQRIELTMRFKDPIFGLKPRNREQHFALDACLRDDIALVTLIGKAGTGKTLMALAAGLHRVAEEGHYQKLLVSRPIFPMGRDIGYLPGAVEDKLRPWMQPIHDNVEYLMGLQPRKGGGRGAQELIAKGLLEIEPLTYIRGRSIPHQFLIVDEAQNLTTHEVKTIVSRAGEGSKIVLTGDPYQIDNPYMDATSNGLVHAVNRFRGHGIAGHITLHRGERSELAELAANVL